jgi:hypothetical protein
MNKVILLFAALVMGAASANAQSLKETLFSGKLKSDSGSVVRKSDDLSTKIDSTPRKQVEQPKLAPPMKVDAKGNLVPGEGTSETVASTPGSTPTSAPATTTTIVTNADGTTTTTTVPVTDAAPVDNKPRDNNAIWKTYIDELTTTLRTEVMTSSKVKKGNYSVLIDYNIETDGAITVNSVSSVPKSDYIEEQIKQRMTLGSPAMTPLLGTNGKPRKAANRKQTIQLAK